MQKESKVIKKLVMMSLLINTFEGFYSYPWWLVLSNFTESRITWEMSLWARQWGMILVLYFEVGDLISWVSLFSGSDTGLHKWKTDMEQRHAFILSVPGVTSCLKFLLHWLSYHDGQCPEMISLSLFPSSCFVSVFCHSNRKKKRRTKLKTAF